MQDEYVKAIEKIQMNKDRKIEMRKYLENEMASATTEVKAEHVGKRAKTTRLSKGAKAGIAAAAIAATMGILMAIPSSRNVINASIRALFNIEVPKGATDGQIKEQEDRALRQGWINELPSAQKSEIAANESSSNKALDDFYKEAGVKAEYYKDAELNRLAKYYSDKQMNLMDLKKSVKNTEYFNLLNSTKADWFSDGFFINFWVGSNDSGHNGTIICFKATEEQLNIFLKRNYDDAVQRMKDHGQKVVSFDEFWKKSTDEDGNTVYVGNWKGPEPTEKLLPSDCASFRNVKLVYDTKNHIANSSIEEGGGVG